MLFDKAEEYIKKTGIDALLQNASCVIVGFSGGADSSVLLSFFVSQREKFPNLKIIAAHMNHMIRGEEADRDEAFCRKVCHDYGVELAVQRTDIPGLSKKSGKGLEETARKERYAFFERLQKENGSALIATAHNADDNLETVILNLTRGSGTKGISGITPVKGGNCIRPLLFCTSEQIRSFAKEKGIEYVTDSTNFDTDYTRNAVRHKVIPHLREINPKVAEAALRLSRAAREDCEYIEKEAQKISEKPLSQKEAKALSSPVLARVISQMYKKAAGAASDLSEKNISDCRELILSPEGGMVSLPHNLAFFADKDEIYIAKDPRFDKIPASECPEIAEIKPGEKIMFGDFCILCAENGNYITNIDENIYNLSLHVSLDYDRISGNLIVRSRRPGDTLRLRKMNRKLKKLLCDADVPRRLRAGLPVIEDAEGIVFVPFIGARDGCGASADSKRVLNLHIYKRSML